MSMAINRPLVAQKPVAPRVASADFAAKSAAAKVALGWKETVKDLPSEAVDKLKRTAHAIANPIETIERKIDEVKANPKKVLLPLGMMAGGALLTAISPGLMRVVGVGMTASMFVFPSIKFAKARSEAELIETADGTSKQLVDYAASYATSWAAGKVIRYSLDKFKERQAHVGSQSIQGHGDVEGKADMTMRGDGPVNPDDVNHRAFRTNKEMGHELVTQVRANVADQTYQSIAAQNPGLTRPQFDAWLQTPEARPVRLQMVQQVRGVVHYQNLSAHGIQGVENMDIAEMAKLRKYLQDFNSSYDLSDAAKGINAGMAKGLTESGKLAVEAERFLYTERGVGAPQFGRLERVGFEADGLKKVRRFADSFAPSESGKYLNKAAMSADTPNVEALRGVITRQLATDVGFIVPKNLDDRTLLTLVHDLSDKDPGSTREIVKAVNDAFRQGKTNYYEINEAATRRLLKNLGADDAVLAGMDAKPEAFKADVRTFLERGGSKPADVDRMMATADLDALAMKYRAEQVTLLHDRLKVLPAAQRTEVLAGLQSGKANLMNFDSVLSGQLDNQLAKLAGGNAEVVKAMTADMTIQQKTNFTTDMARLPQDVRATAFANLTGTPEQMHKTAVDRLATAIESKFDVKVHRETGRYPNDAKWYREDDAFVLDWGAQGTTQLYNGLNQMAPNGAIPAGMRGTTYVRMNGSAPSPGMVPWTMPSPKGGQPLMHYRPGSGAYDGGTMGYRTFDGQKDMIVLFDDALKMPNHDEAIGVTLSEGTIIHESGHAAQLGGLPGMTDAQRTAAEQKLVSEWSALSDWRERDGSLADGYYGFGDNQRRYYKDPAVEVRVRNTVPSNYGATDTVEDFAEFTRLFYNDPAEAMKMSTEKFLYMNQMMGNRYSPEQTTALAHGVGIGPEGITQALAGLRQKLKGVPGNSVAPTGILEKINAALRAA